MKRPSMTALALTLGLALAAAGTVAAPRAGYGDAVTGAAEKEKWAHHMGDLPFIVGYEAGMKEVEFTGKPPLLFFTATW